MKVYILYYDTSHGSNEEWNLFYLNPEIYTTQEQVEARKKYIRSVCSDDSLSFYEITATLDPSVGESVHCADVEDDDDRDWHPRALHPVSITDLTSCLKKDNG